MPETAELQTVSVGTLSPERFRSVLSEEQADQFEAALQRAPETFSGRVVWNVNSTANGGGVAEMLHSLIAYARGASVDARWVVISGNDEFFRITKRIHNRLHGAEGDGGPLGEEEQQVYRDVAKANADRLVSLVHEGDIVLLHDPQTAGLAQPLVDAGAHVIWRCHVGIDNPNERAREAWRFLVPHVKPAARYVFSREAFEWEGLDRERMTVIPPSIDAFSPKNQDLDDEAVAAIVGVAGLGPDGNRQQARFTRQDGSPGRVDRPAELWEDEPIPGDAPVVLQVSRWDSLKDPLGVIDGFVEDIADDATHLLLAGPEVAAVADDPEGLQVLQQCIARRDELDPGVRRFVHLAALPMTDSGENAAIVNALQRRATVVVQKSLAEGFGLTVAEAMWKAAPVVASRIGGIQDQIVDGESGLLVDPSDLKSYGDAVRGLLADDDRAEAMGSAARERVRGGFLGARHLLQYIDLFSEIIAGDAG